MAPIRTAIIGLSASAKTSWASNAHLPYLLSARGRSRFEIVALCNSSVEAAQKAIAHFNLPKETRAYGDPQSLANDKDVELVVVSTRVDVHHGTALPSVKAGKTVFVEWPLAQDSSHAEELAGLARESGSHTIVGLQGRVAPPVVKLRHLLQQGRIGQVLSSEIHAAGGTMDRDLLSPGLKYFTDKAIGGNVFTIGLGHLFDQVQYVLGELSDFKSHVQIQRPNVRIRDPATNKILETIKSDVPDLVFAVGTLSESTTSQDGASVLLRFRRGQPFNGEPALVWTINGEKGEIRLVAQDGTTLHANAYTGPVTIEIHDFETNQVETVEWSWEEWQEGLPVLARSVGAVYEIFADGGIESLPSFDDALLRHQQLTGILEN
ncbi:hypothetical protein BGZ61DRAFT_434870 [Ilyonectria robusta]|uniref:uncharacterized protein n=1 Tax=Ilyonectria robusta TaxID=1079257 RepID=UPI001E8CC5A6|nr:uncharacterized protein BGZ61DRAFT_434870 [Ilyonectria robusta]KAH8654882.1 hypothetical protein BGZ61DRAFT_434870 [Ilyonectria robusta]